MKLSRSSQLAMAAAASVAAAMLITACQQFTQSLTVDFVYVATSRAAGPNQYGEINVFEINSESGRMRQIPTSPFPSGGRNPVAEAVSSDNQNLFVVNHDDNSIVQFAIGTDGKLYPNDTVNSPGIFPLAIAVDKSNVYVVDTYEPGPLCSPADPCSGSISVFPLTAAGGVPNCQTSVCLSTPANNPAVNGQYWPLTVPSVPNDIIVPTGVNVLASGSFVYVTAYDSSTPSPVGYVFEFSVGAGGVLTPLPGSPIQPYESACGPSHSAAYLAQPSAIASGYLPQGAVSSSSNFYLYVTDTLKGNVWGLSANSTGALTALGCPYAAGNQPSAVVVNPSYPYVYVANAGDSTISAYSLSASNGQLNFLGNSSSPVNYVTGTQPVAIGIDPSTNRFLFTVNFLGDNISNFELSPTQGTLLDAQNSPYLTNAQPVAVAAIPHNGTGGGVQSQ